MKHITVDDETAHAIVQATDSVEARDRQGRHLGYSAPDFSDEDIAIAKQRLASNAPRYMTKEVFDHLRSLKTE